MTASESDFITSRANRHFSGRQYLTPRCYQTSLKPSIFSLHFWHIRHPPYTLNTTPPPHTHTETRHKCLHARERSSLSWSKKTATEFFRIIKQPLKRASQEDNNECALVAENEHKTGNEITECKENENIMGRENRLRNSRRMAARHTQMNKRANVEKEPSRHEAHERAMDGRRDARYTERQKEQWCSLQGAEGETAVWG